MKSQGGGSMQNGISIWASAIRLIACAFAFLLSPAVSWAQSDLSDEGPIVAVNVAGAPQASARHSLGSAEAEMSPVSSRPRSAVSLSVSRGADLVGRPSTVVREELGDEFAASSYSDQPVIRIGLQPDVSASPLASLRITSRFGARRHPIDGVTRQHAGVDYGAAHGAPIMATGNGTVVLAGNAGGYGLMVKLDHGSGLETRYAHMSRIAVSVGDKVTNGQVIGYVGSTGRSTGSHLHYETRLNGRAVNPLDR